ncbi:MULTISPECIES: DUF6916 family protein [unclassified Sphingosinithalassobacter]|uniref:DUF6916 family protein n=1 Tax=unclassified Sphingosinithalassobacter TaxID=2676235 RepID=UPI00165DB6C3|nr:hypothetical protein [Sphingosinithalassobacter sp. CS137]
MRLLAPEDFEPWVGRKVRVNTLPKPVEVTLERIERRPPLPEELDFREPFSLFFESEFDVYLLDTAYEFDCGRGGPYSFVISQLVPSKTRRYYQAVFA